MFDEQINKALAMNAIEKYKNLALMDGFLFEEIMRKRPDLLKQMLEAILNREIAEITFLEFPRYPMVLRIEVDYTDLNGDAWDAGIIIGTVDPYGKGDGIYSIGMSTKGDGAESPIWLKFGWQIIININGKVEDKPELEALLKYFRSGIATTELTSALNEEVISAKSNSGWQSEFYKWCIDSVSVSD